MCSLCDRKINARCSTCYEFLLHFDPISKANTSYLEIKISCKVYEMILILAKNVTGKIGIGNNGKNGRVGKYGTLM